MGCCGSHPEVAPRAPPARRPPPLTTAAAPAVAERNVTVATPPVGTKENPLSRRTQSPDDPPLPAANVRREDCEDPPTCRCPVSAQSATALVWVEVEPAVPSPTSVALRLDFDNGGGEVGGDALAASPPRAVRHGAALKAVPMAISVVGQRSLPPDSSGPYAVLCGAGEGEAAPVVCRECGDVVEAVPDAATIQHGTPTTAGRWAMDAATTPSTVAVRTGAPTTPGGSAWLLQCRGCTPVRSRGALAAVLAAAAKTTSAAVSPCQACGLTASLSTAPPDDPRTPASPSLPPAPTQDAASIVRIDVVAATGAEATPPVRTLNVALVPSSAVQGGVYASISLTPLPASAAATPATVSLPSPSPPSAMLSPPLDLSWRAYYWQLPCQGGAVRTQEEAKAPAVAARRAAFLEVLNTRWDLVEIDVPVPPPPPASPSEARQRASSPQASSADTPKGKRGSNAKIPYARKRDSRDAAPVTHCFVEDGKTVGVQSFTAPAKPKKGTAAAKKRPVKKKKKKMSSDADGSADAAKVKDADGAAAAITTVMIKGVPVQVLQQPKPPAQP
eukprot:TRINITY_DN21336_c0_g1_i1.p1 TRINITY_DN21336_c0_g1~~TRINITY_DN21336_c0_g1_i1.p1  ORF type:complete len:559 (+),score=126.21 TRINITY_DN21336_c0_g1_i1:89-1765(+)